MKKYVSGFCIYLVILLGFIFIFFHVVIDAKGQVTHAEIMQFAGTTVTSLALAITFALGVLAINAFANNREIEKSRQEIDKSYKLVKERTQDIDHLLSIIPEAFEVIADVFPDGDDANYFKLTHSRFLFRLLLSDTYSEKLDICRDIIGSMRPEHSQEVLLRTREICAGLISYLPDERDTIRTLLSEADKTLLEMRHSQV